MVEVRLRPGKADYMTRKLPDGSLEIVCLCKHNADMSKRGCISQVPGQYIQAVVNGKGYYPPELRSGLKDERNGKLPDEKCRYCDSRRHNYGAVTIAEIGKNTRKDFEILKPEFVRISKNNEAGHPYYRKTLLEFLELCKEFGTQAIFPTKMLEYNEKVATLLKETNSTLLYSLGWDRLEPGVCSQGFTNTWRTEEAEEYLREGVNTSLTIVCDVTSSIGENVSQGNIIGKALNPILFSPLNRRIIPFRPNSRKVAQELGIDWDEAKYAAPIPEDGHPNLLSEEYVQGLEEQANSARYFLARGGKLIARYFHPDFHGFRDSIKVCGRVGDLEYCDKCNTGLEPIVFPASELIKVEYGDKKRVSRKKYQEKKRKQRGQLELFS